jgi:hypothetical protein
MPALDDRFRPLLVGRIGVGVEQADCQGGHPLGDHVIDDPGQFRFIDAGVHGAVEMGTLVDFKAKLARNERLRQFDEKIVELVFELPAHLERISESLGRDQPGHRAATLDQGIREERRRMDDLSDRLGSQARLGEEVMDPGHGALRRIARGRQFLVREDVTIVVPIDDDVGEGTANVDTEGARHHVASVLTENHLRDRGRSGRQGDPLHHRSRRHPVSGAERRTPF